MRFATEAELTANQEGKVESAYLAEVETHTDRRVREYAAAERRLEAAQKRHAAAVTRASKTSGKSRRVAQSEIDRMWELVEERVHELRRLAALMTEIPGYRSPAARHRS